MLRDQQVRIMNKYLGEVEKGNSLVHQMIMGAGKTTVIGPLLALMLADGKQLVTQVVPNQLLEMSRGVMRQCFSAIISKPVYTFTFQRADDATAGLYRKLIKARSTKAVVCSTPTGIKSFQLKFMEIVHMPVSYTHLTLPTICSV